MGVIRNGLNLNKINSFWQQVIIGLILVLAVARQMYRQRKNNAAGPSTFKSIVGRLFRK